MERGHEWAADQTPGWERRASERHALAVDRRIDRHAGLIENGAAGGVDVANVGKVEPLAPPLPVVDVQKRETVEIGGRAQAAAAGDNGGTAHWKKLPPAHTGHIHAGIRARPAARC